MLQYIKRGNKNPRGLYARLIPKRTARTGAPRRHSIDSPDAEVLLPPAAVRYRSPGAGNALENF